jgi:hypothetical protein
MRTHTIRRSLTRIGLTLLVPGAAAALALTVVVQAHASVPFSASFSGTVAFTSPTTVAFDGSGQASHMGRSSNDGVAAIIGPPDQAGCIPNANTETLTAANGDQLTIQSDDLACPIASGPILHASGEWTVVDGTGRFAGATGSGTLDGESNFNNGTFQFTLTGSLSY